MKCSWDRFTIKHWNWTNLHNKTFLITKKISIKRLAKVWNLVEYLQKKRRGRWLPEWPKRPSPLQEVFPSHCGPWWGWRSQTPPRSGTWSGHMAAWAPKGTANCISETRLRKKKLYQASWLLILWNCAAFAHCCRQICERWLSIHYFSPF